MAQLTRFLPKSVLNHFEQVAIGRPAIADTSSAVKPIGDIRKKISGRWT